MSDPRHNFITHRCEAMPHGFSLRKYTTERDYKGRRNSVGVWVLGSYEYDFEWSYPYLDSVAHVRFCPWCGERLDGSDD